jgi:hypothetical protein
MVIVRPKHRRQDRVGTEKPTSHKFCSVFLFLMVQGCELVLTLARQVLYHLSHSTSLKVLFWTLKLGMSNSLPNGDVECVAE